MKTAHVFIASIALVVGTFFNSAAQEAKPTQPEVSVKFRNNRLCFSKVAMVSYSPKDNGGNGTEVKVMMPYSVVERNYEVGTKIYFANNRQVDVVMSGKKIEDRPFMVVKAEDAGKTFDIHQ
jgi:hypothetical protein